MDKREKVDFILEQVGRTNSCASDSDVRGLLSTPMSLTGPAAYMQMRLALARSDYIRTQILSKKISSRFFDDEAMQVCCLDVCTPFRQQAPSNRTLLRGCRT